MAHWNKGKHTARGTLGVSGEGCYEGLTGPGLYEVIWGRAQGSRTLLWIGRRQKTRAILWSVIWTTPVQKAGRTQWNKEAESTLLPGAGARWSFLCFRQCYVFVWVQTWLWRDVGLHLIDHLISSWDNSFLESTLWKLWVSAGVNFFPSQLSS